MGEGMRAFFRAFACAGRGIWHAFLAERNLRFHLCAAVYVYLFSTFYSLSAAAYAVLTAVIFGVIALELLNSAIERIVNRLSPGYNKQAGIIKDMAAGAVLVFCIGAAVCGFLLFWDLSVFSSIFSYFYSHPVRLVLLLLSLGFSGWLIFGFRPRQRP